MELAIIIFLIGITLILIGMILFVVYAWLRRRSERMIEDFGYTWMRQIEDNQARFEEMIQK